VAQVAIRTLHELLKSDKAGHIDTVVFNGLVDTTDPGSGQGIRPCLVTVRATRESFSQLDLDHVEPLACLKHLSAGVSKSPAELLPVRPVLEFNMVDPRFVAESDALSELDQRPNLMELSWLEFEALIQNLFVKMGLEARQTRASRDGGVDCVAWDPRPIFGGKVVIQAKRYKNTVGVSAVRDLFGTLQNEGASKGILVTTSGYGQASFDFAKNKPIELIDGSNLTYLLAEHTGIEAKIVPPDDWKDPIADMPGQDT
jgi:restriction system protein